MGKQLNSKSEVAHQDLTVCDLQVMSTHNQLSSTDISVY
jgi:hypothetical protein